MTSEARNDCTLDALVGHLDSVICGDNAEVMATFHDACIDLVVTSPPYDDLRKYGGHSWDFPAVARQLTRILKPGGVVVWVVGDATVDGSETLTSMKQAIHFRDVCGLNVETMVWEKTGSGCLGSGSYYGQNWEYMLVCTKGAPSHGELICDRRNAITEGTVTVNASLDNEGKGTRRTVQRKEFGKRTNVWRMDTQKNSEHPAPFPERLAADHILSWSNHGDVVLDPFAGSGTTLKMAKEHGRRYIGIEVNPEYVAICEKRAAQGVLPLMPNAEHDTRRE